ncbi:MAG: hypothetical protein JO290_03515 [Sphingomonadaceae bacterium]|nr:hypothetical protein [Sphingomonadaceae bacterium]
MKLDLAPDEATVVSDHLKRFRHTVRSLVKDSIAAGRHEHEVREQLRQHERDLHHAIASRLGHDRATAIFDMLRSRWDGEHLMAEIDRKYPE